MTEDGYQPYHLGIDTSGTADITYMSSTAASSTGQEIIMTFVDEVSPSAWPPAPRNRAERRKRKRLRAGYTRRSPWPTKGMAHTR